MDQKITKDGKTGVLINKEGMDVKMDEEKSKIADLMFTAKKLCEKGKGILAADESTGTIGKRFAPINVENNEENRRAYRELLFTTPDIEQYISGVIMYEETLFQKDSKGNSFVSILNDLGIIVGIKTDMGTAPLFTDTTYTQGLDKLAERCQKYYDAGARFCKWRCVLKIQDNIIPEASMITTAVTLAQYAIISQRCGLVPIVEPEILMDGKHDLITCGKNTKAVLSELYNTMNKFKVMLESTLLKVNMITPGINGPAAPANMIGIATISTMNSVVPPAVPGIMFLSGGQSEEEATINLNSINQSTKIINKQAFQFSFSYGRALQQSCLKAWGGKPENVKQAQGVLLARAKANSDASKGEYIPSTQTNESASVKSFVENYSY